LRLAQVLITLRLMRTMLDRVPLGVYWTIATFSGWLVGVAVQSITNLAPSFGAALAGFSPWHYPWRWLAGNVGYSRQYRLPPQTGLELVWGWVTVVGFSCWSWQPSGR
jgi:hypothetical protein